MKREPNHFIRSPSGPAIGSTAAIGSNGKVCPSEHRAATSPDGTDGQIVPLSGAFFEFNPAIVLSLIYMWWFITTPMFAPRLAFLAEWSFEKFLAGAFVIMALIFGNVANLTRPIPILLGALFVWMVICSSMSPYSGDSSVLHWQEYYWKQLVFFACLTVSVRTVRQMRTVILGVGGILFFYQLHSWFDFLNGGAYVYQQGMKRMKGVWADSGYGAGNAWAYLGLFGVPLAVACYRLLDPRREKKGAVGFLITSFLSILFSGGRGALISATVYMLVVFRRHLHRFRGLVVVGVLLALGFPLLPNDVQHRVLSLVREVDEEQATRADQIASDSARGRLEGLLDGIAIANQSPVFGCGPSASALAAYALHRNRGDDDGKEGVLQLHNLYGQVAAELGYLGITMWLVLIAACLVVVYKGLHASGRGQRPSEYDRRVFHSFALGCLGVFLLYGMAGHTLYDFRWLFLFGLINALSGLDERA